MMLLFSYLCIFMVVSPSKAAQQLWNHEVALDGDPQVHLGWVIREDYITLHLSVEALGYVAVGFSPNGGMKGSDIAMAWVTDDGTAMFYDMYAEGNMAPVVDDSQDYDLIHAEQNASHTIVSFRRKLLTCDMDHDFDLGEDTLRVIWAYSDTDPVDVNSITYHGRKRGVKSLFLMSNPGYVPTEKELEAYEYWDVMSPEIVLKGDTDTVYWCSIVKVPSDLFNTKKHIVGSAPILQNGNEAYVHHIVLYFCSLHGDYADYVEQVLANSTDQEGTVCYSEQMPPEWYRCSSMVLGWGIGSEGEMFVKEAGLPIESSEDKPIYMKLEMHYDNPMLHKDIADASGIRLFYTDDLRPNDAAVVVTGAAVTPVFMIPPKQQSFPIVGMCTSEYTRQAIPPEGLKIFQVFPHAHTAGAAVRIRHFRDGQELAPIIEDNNYDFNYQQTRIFPEPFTVLPGDELLVECDYNTMGRDTLTYSGLGSNDEMCLGYMTYYPAVSFSGCLSQPSQESLASLVDGKLLKPEQTKWKAFGVFPKNAGDNSFLDTIVYESPENENFTFLDKIREMTWAKQEVDALIDVYTNKDVYVNCFDATLNACGGPVGQQQQNVMKKYGKRKRTGKHMKQCGKKDKYQHVKSTLYQKLVNKFTKY